MVIRPLIRTYTGQNWSIRADLRSTDINMAVLIDYPQHSHLVTVSMFAIIQICALWAVTILLIYKAMRCVIGLTIIIPQTQRDSELLCARIASRKKNISCDFYTSLTPGHRRHFLFCDVNSSADASLTIHSTSYLLVFICPRGIFEIEIDCQCFCPARYRLRWSAAQRFYRDYKEPILDQDIIYLYA